jgi:hypothetical protein
MISKEEIMTKFYWLRMWGGCVPVRFFLDIPLKDKRPARERAERSRRLVETRNFPRNESRVSAPQRRWGFNFGIFSRGGRVGDIKKRQGFPLVHSSTLIIWP